MAQEDMVEIPASIRVACPLVAFKLRSLGEHCPQCEHFRGLQDRYPGNSKIAFHARYTVACSGEPTKRQLFEVE